MSWFSIIFVCSNELMSSFSQILGVHSAQSIRYKDSVIKTAIKFPNVSQLQQQQTCVYFVVFYPEKKNILYSIHFYTEFNLFIILFVPFFFHLRVGGLIIKNY